MKINEIFYSLQGEGYHTGRAGVFVRFSGCNLKCPFCDTDFHSYKEMGEEKIVEEILKADTGNSKFVIITGGEPTLQLTATLITKLKREGYYVAIETNGCGKNPSKFGLDWITISPKSPFLSGGKGVVLFPKCDEVKLVVDLDNITEETLTQFQKRIEAYRYYLQPCDTGNDKTNAKILDYTLWLLKQNPKWRLSLQTQKILDIR